MANTKATPTWTCKESLRYFANSLKGVASFNRSYDGQYVQNGAKVGNTVKARLPQQWAIRSGQAFDQQNILDQTVDIVLNKQRGIDFGFSSAEATHDLDEIRSRYVQPAAETLAAEFDAEAMDSVYKDIYNARGALGTTSATALLYLQLGVDLDDGATGREGRVGVLDPMAVATLSNAQQALFHPSAAISENNKTGMFAANQLGVSKWFMDQNVPSFTCGVCAAASTPLVNGAGQTGSSLVTDGWGAASAPVEGDTFTIAGVFSVNPVSKRSTGRVQRFVLTATPTAGTGPTFTISPSIITSGSLQTVSNSPADNAVITYWAMAAGGTQAAVVSPQSLMFHPDAFAAVMADLVQPAGGASGSRISSKQLGISIRYVQQYQVLSDQNLSRLDILFGAATLQARLAGRMVG